MKKINKISVDILFFLFSARKFIFKTEINQPPRGSGIFHAKHINLFPDNFRFKKGRMRVNEQHSNILREKKKTVQL